MRNKAFLALLAMSVALMLPVMAAANETDPLVLTVTGIGYHESVTEYVWAAEASVTSGGSVVTAVNLIAGGYIALDYDLDVTRIVKPVVSRHGFRGGVKIKNNTNDDQNNLALVLTLLVREGEGAWTATEYATTLSVHVDEGESVTLPYDFKVDMTKFSQLNQQTMNFKVLASTTLGANNYVAEKGSLSVPTAVTMVDVNRAAVVDVDFVWLHLGNPIAVPTGVTILASPAAQSWILDTGNLINGAVTLDLLTVLGTLGYNGASGPDLHGLRMDVSITPADSPVFVADTLLLPVNITVPATGSHSVHFYVTGGHGSIVAKLGTSELHLGATIPAGSQLSFVASPEAGYKVKEWKINNVVQPGKGLVLNIQYLAVNTLVTVEFAPVDAMTDDDDDDDDDDDNPAAPALANKILKENNIPHRIATTTLKKNGKATYINLIAAVAKQSKGTSFMGVDRANQAAYYTAVYNYLKQLGAQLP